MIPFKKNIYILIGLLWILLVGFLYYKDARKTASGFAFDDIKYLNLLDANISIQEYRPKSEIHVYMKIHVSSNESEDKWIIDAKSLLLQNGWVVFKNSGKTLCNPQGAQLTFYDNGILELYYLSNTRTECKEN